VTPQFQRLVFGALAVFFCSVVLISYGLKVRAASAPITTGAEPRDAHLNRGLDLHRQGSLDEALKEYTAAADADPASALAFYNIGTVHYEKKNFRGAIEAYQRAVTIDPKFADAQFNLGYTRLHQVNDAAGAIEPLQKAVEASPQMAKAYFELGNAYHATGAADRAEPLWKIAATIDPRLAGAVAAQRTSPAPAPAPRR
jgi:tetratricopeptide (TPR) repeat protein